MKKEISRKIDDVEFTVKYEEYTIDNIAYADGANLKTGETLHTDCSISVKKGKASIFTRDLSFFYKIDPDKTRTEKGVEIKVYPEGAYARLGDNYISKKTHDVIVDMLKEVGSDYGKEETPKLEIIKEPVRGAGYCHKCESYCYGDCTA